MSRQLVEGVDFDAMGPVLYKDELITIVESGGIPIYTAVGYGGDLGGNVDKDIICGPGNGLKTFDRLYRENQLPKLTAEERDIYTKKYNTMSKEEKGKIFNKYERGITSVEDKNIWKFNNVPEEIRAEARNKYFFSSFRKERFDLDPTYGSRIFFRAPTTWPHKLDVKALKENLKGSTFFDLHMNRAIYKLFMGDGDSTDIGVVIRVDPNKTFVISSNMRVRFPKEVVDMSKITLSEHLLQLKERGYGFLAPEYEILATPPDGFLGSEKFSECVVHARKANQDYDRFIKIGKRIEKIPYISEAEEEKSKNLPKDAYNEGVHRFDFVTLPIILKLNPITELIEYLKILENLPKPPAGQENINEYILKIRKISKTLLEPIKRKFYPYIIKLYTILTNEDIAELKSILQDSWTPPEDFQVIPRQIDILTWGSERPKKEIEKFYKQTSDYLSGINEPDAKERLNLVGKNTLLGKVMLFLVKVSDPKKYYISKYLESLPELGSVKEENTRAAAGSGKGGGRKSRKNRKGRKAKKSRKN